MALNSVSLALTGSGGAGVMTSGQVLVDAAAKAGWYGLMARSLGPQIRGGESAALLRLSPGPVQSMDDCYDLMLAVDWGNIERFASEIPLTSKSIIVTDPAQGEVPEIMRRNNPIIVEIPLKEIAKSVEGGRINMVALGLVAKVIGLPEDYCIEVLSKALAKKGPEALEKSIAGMRAGADHADKLTGVPTLDAPRTDHGERWSITGNEATGLGALRGGVRFVAAYPITPATEVLEYMAPNLPKLGGALVQAEDELASINMAIGGSFGGVPSLTATSGPGLALMTESIGLAVASETPVVIINVQRGGPSTGIPTKSEQVDLNIAINGLHGDAPHLVTAPTSIADSLFTAQWTVHMAEAMQCPAIVLTDQAMGQARAIIDKPADLAFVGQRRKPELVSGAVEEGYQRYAVTKDGVSPMAIPGMKGGEYTADGLEHSPKGTPSTQAQHHQEQLDKRERKLKTFDYGDHWADIEGDGEIAIITWGSVTEQVREAIDRIEETKSLKVKLIALRLLSPALPEKMAEALNGVRKALIVEQSHSKQYTLMLKAHYDLPPVYATLNRPGPLAIRPHEIVTALDALVAKS
ncbi:2-oxoacid:acceptor oxidoreductase subunit alpha [Caenispirillum salinarum]|uniref:2-oxoacid:acceptor oxidoreductase subunit alpha n=1 Tax=Caenispirillum salinarum TaxID=859058 RepID=UPI00384C6805